MPSLTVHLVGLPPTVNHQYSHRGGQVFLTEDAKIWRAAAVLDVRAAAAAAGFEVPPSAPLALHILFTAPSIGRWDLDGRLKLLIDATAEGGGFNDNRVTRLEVRKQAGPAPSTQITIRPDQPGPLLLDGAL